jgi:3-deoxy-7-phosphoheptulonate synthase
MSLAAAAAGADGLIVEVHDDPGNALCDGPQALHASEFAGYADRVRRVAEIAGRDVAVAV